MAIAIDSPTLTSVKPIDWNYFISKRGKAWQPSAIRGLFPLEKTPGLISFLAGKPNPETFPFSSISCEVKPIIPGGETVTLKIEHQPLDDALQYGATSGLDGLVAWVNTLQSTNHKRENDGSWKLTIGSGSQDLIFKAMQSLINEGDSILLETPVYPGTLGVLYPETANLIEIATDTEGLIPASLEDTLANWSTLHPEKRFPKLLYTIPTGSNPTGCSSPLHRKIEILALAKKYNLLLLEDDAYYYLHFDRSVQAASYFELEGRDGPVGTAGRVLRFDTFSKVLSSGMRLGFMTGPAPIIDVVNLATSNSNLQPSSIAQAIVLALLNHWGLTGFMEHTRRVAKFYENKRDMFEAIAHKHLDGLATWVSPDSGMFLFIKLSLSEDPTAISDSSDFISKKAVAAGVLAVPGVAFMPSRSVSAYVRVAFSLAEEEQTNEAFRRLKGVIESARAESKKL